MDASDTSADQATGSAAKKTRKTPIRRARAHAEVESATLVPAPAAARSTSSIAALGASEVVPSAPKRGRSRRPKSEEAAMADSPELFTQAPDAAFVAEESAPPAAMAPVAAEPVAVTASVVMEEPSRPFVASFSPDGFSPVGDDAGIPESFDIPTSSDERPIFVPTVEKEVEGGHLAEGYADQAPGAEAGVAEGLREGGGVPDGLRDEHDEAAPGTAGVEPGFGGGGAQAQAPGAPGGNDAGGARREERKTWWERKKEKKRLKWLERQQGGGHGGQAGPGGPALAGGANAGAPTPAFADADRGTQGGASGAPTSFGAGGPAGFVPTRSERDRGRERERGPAQTSPVAVFAPTTGLPDASRLSDLTSIEALADELAKDLEPIDLGLIHAALAPELAQRLRTLGESVVGIPSRRVLVEGIFNWAAREKRAFRERGILDLTDAGHGFVTHLANSYRLSPECTFVSAALVKHHGLRRGQNVDVLVQPPQPGERCPSVVRVNSVMGLDPAAAREVTAFEELIPYYPTARILVEAPEIHKDISMRAVDLLTPIGFGQRGLIVAPPRTGKTVLLQNIANSITQNYPDATLILLLIDERPEEVTDFRRHTKGEVVSSTFDESPESHAHAAEMVIERARRLVELGKHVIILLDSITRLARAYNALAGNGGKTMSGGIESNALQRPKRFFGSARNIEGGGSLTILGTALVDTNSRMDEVIFEEFKGTGNMELHLDRGLSDKRIFPAINIDRSGTRKEELIYHPEEMLRVYGLRRAMQGIPPVEAMDMFIQRLKKTRTNTEFLLSLNR